ncbi:MAG: hypothetical protein H5U36_01760 [Candidatus Caldatribacterium sp.]|nr:hypothetical protein [Candidatus Caldatribacterium sp.]
MARNACFFCNKWDAKEKACTMGFKPEECAEASFLCERWGVDTRAVDGRAP